MNYTIDYSFVAAQIPDVMNALYNERASKDITLEEIRDAFRIKQVTGKQWLLNHFGALVHNKNSKILVIGSWLGFTSLCLHKLGYSNVTEVDPDGRLEDFSKHLNRFNPEFTHITADVNDIDISIYDTIINTSCEHISDNTWFKRIKPDTMIFLHSNNLKGYDDHVNTCENVFEMASKYPMNIIFQGELDFDQWKRFMLIGTASRN